VEAIVIRTERDLEDMKWPDSWESKRSEYTERWKKVLKSKKVIFICFTKDQIDELPVPMSEQLKLKGVMDFEIAGGFVLPAVVLEWEIDSKIRKDNKQARALLGCSSSYNSHGDLRRRSSSGCNYQWSY